MSDNDANEKDPPQPALSVAKGRGDEAGRQGADGASNVDSQNGVATKVDIKNWDVTNIKGDDKTGNVDDAEGEDKFEEGIDDGEGDGEEGNGNETEDEAGYSGARNGGWSFETLDSLYLIMDRQYQMSRLAGRYYYARHFWVMFLPSIMLTMFSGILAFAVTSDFPLSEDTKSCIAFLVGCTSFVSVFLQSLSNETDYDHRAKSQKTLAMGIKRCLVKIDVIRCLGKGAISGNRLTKLEKDFQTMVNQNESVIPPKIIIAYDTASTRLKTKIQPTVGDGNPNHNRVDFNNTLGKIHNELFVAFTAHRGFPLLLPNPETMVGEAFQKLKRDMSAEDPGDGKDLLTLILSRHELISRNHQEQIKNIRKRRHAAAENEVEAEIQHEQKIASLKAKAE